MRPVTHDPQPRPAAGGRLVPLCPWVVTPSLGQGPDGAAGVDEMEGDVG